MKSKKADSQSSKKQSTSALTMWDDDVSDDASDDSSDDASDDDVSGNGGGGKVSAESEAETSCSDYSNSRNSSE